MNGRPGPVSRVRGVYVGVDVGGTKVLAGVVSARGRILATARGSTPGRRVNPEMVEDAVVAAVLEAAGGAPLRGVGIAAAGFVDGAGERVMFAPHLPWQGEDVRARFAKRLRAPVVLDNDANCAAVAEWSYGAARGTDSALMVTLGTGIGGAILFHGRVLRGVNGMAGEFGHMQVVPRGRRCNCGGEGCWEEYCSGSALVRYARESMGQEPTMLDESCGGVPERLTGPMVTQAAEGGDLVARRAFGTVGEWLGVGTANLVAAFDPEIVVVGGGVVDAGERLLAPARIALRQSLVGAEHRTVPDIVPAQLGPRAGLVGAAVLVRRLTIRRERRNPIGSSPLGPGPLGAGTLRPGRRRPRDRAARSAWR
ncbi:MAG: ROK family protein [Nocardioidaceae bacterium]